MLKVISEAVAVYKAYMYYLDAKVMDDDYIMDKLNLSRATYYRRKKEAIIIFGIMLWNTMIEECVGQDYMVIGKAL